MLLLQDRRLQFSFGLTSFDLIADHSSCNTVGVNAAKCLFNLNLNHNK